MSQCGHTVAEVACVDICILGSLGGDTEALWLLFLLFAHLAFPGCWSVDQRAHKGTGTGGVGLCCCTERLLLTC